MLKWSELSARQRNELVAAKVMGWMRGEHLGLKRMVWRYPEGQVIDGFDWQNEVPRFSEEIAAAWEVLVKANVLALYQLPEGWRAVIGRGEWTADAQTAPEAICLAALKACGVDIS